MYHERITREQQFIKLNLVQFIVTHNHVNEMYLGQLLRHIIQIMLHPEQLYAGLPIWYKVVSNCAQWY